MPIKLKTSAPEHVLPPVLSSAVGALKKLKSTADVDIVGPPAVDTKALAGSTPVAHITTLPLDPGGLSHRRSVGDRWQGAKRHYLHARRRIAQGLKLQARRVKEGNKPGFELLFQLTDDALKSTLERLESKEATSSPVTFRGAEIDSHGIAAFTATVATISGGSTHAPPDMNHDSGTWSMTLSETKGAKISVVNHKAALAMRGLVRIELYGDDKECTEQLKSLVKTLGMQHIFSPPTAKSKEVFMLMRVLWQADHSAAKSFAAECLDKVKVSDLRAALESVGYGKARIAGLSYQEVFPGHFTVVDPTQAKEMVEAGARYLYSTVETPEHVHAILQNGQKSSVQRYKEGLIIEGMSTDADFVTGGGSGVFTRLVTQNAIYAEEVWNGRTYKLLQNHSQLGRTDWHGWDGDYYGRRWGLKTQVNFGAELVKKIAP